MCQLVIALLFGCEDQIDAGVRMACRRREDGGRCWGETCGGVGQNMHTSVWARFEVCGAFFEEITMAESV